MRGVGSQNGSGCFGRNGSNQFITSAVGCAVLPRFLSPCLVRKTVFWLWFWYVRLGFTHEQINLNQFWFCSFLNYQKKKITRIRECDELQKINKIKIEKADTL